MIAGPAVNAVIDPVHRLAAPESRGSASIFGVNDVLVIEGWAYLVATKSAADAVYILIDGERAARAVVNIDRPDVAAAFASKHADLGFRAVIVAEPFGAGLHEISLAVVHGESHDTVASMSITIIEPQCLRVTTDVHLDPIGPLNADQGARVDYGDSLVAAGWALKPLDAKPPRIVVIVDERYVFEADCGLPRPDVAAAYALPDIGYGFETTIDTDIVGAGSHTARARIVEFDPNDCADSETVQSLQVNAF
jgi:hypothetical protein